MESIVESAFPRLLSGKFNLLLFRRPKGRWRAFPLTLVRLPAGGIACTLSSPLPSRQRPGKKARRMVGRKHFPGPGTCFGWNKSDISLICQSATDALIPWAMSAPRYWQYERVGICDVNKSSSSPVPLGCKKSRKAATLKVDLGSGSSSGYLKSRAAKLNRLMKAPTALFGRMKERYADWKSDCSRANLRVSDLFAGNQLFLHLHPAPVKRLKKQHDLKPSLGLLAG